MIEIVGIFEAIGIVLGAGGAIVGTILGGIKAVKYVANWHRKKIQKEKEDKELKSTVAEIYKQLKPNGGSSLRDSVDKIDSRLLRLEEQAGMSAQVSSLILLDAGLAVFHADKEGNFSSVNRTFQIIAGRAESDLADLGWTSCIDYDQRAETLEEWLESVKYEREFHAEFSIVHTDGTKHPVSCKAFPLRNKDGDVTGWMGFVRKMDTSTSPAVYRR